MENLTRRSFVQILEFHYYTGKCGKFENSCKFLNFDKNCRNFRSLIEISKKLRNIEKNQKYPHLPGRSILNLFPGFWKCIKFYKKIQIHKIKAKCGKGWRKNPCYPFEYFHSHKTGVFTKQLNESFLNIKYKHFWELPHIFDGCH